MANIGSKAFTSAGTLFAMTTSPLLTYDVAGFAACTWVDVEEITDLGQFGKVYTEVTHNPLGDRRTVKRRGSYNTGTMPIKMARVPSGAGQAILVAANDSDASHPCRVTLQDGTIFYFTAQILSYTTNIGTVNQITAADVSASIDNDILEVAP